MHFYDFAYTSLVDDLVEVETCSGNISEKRLLINDCANC